MTASVSVPVPIDQRFAQLVQQFGLTKNSFAISLGKTASVVQHLIDGRNKPGYDLLCKVFEIYPNVSRDWLLLGRGPMLVSGEHAPKSVAATVVAAPELPLEPIDLTDVEVPTHRRSVAGVAGSRLQPDEIAATLALAAAANQPARASVSSSSPIEAEPAKSTGLPHPVAPAINGSFVAPIVPEASVASMAQPQPTVLPAAETPIFPTALQAAIAVAPVASTSAGPDPGVYVTAALNAQHLQHQLALAEMRNQHLLEQQQMLREMLAMARQAMV